MQYANVVRSGDFERQSLYVYLRRLEQLLDRRRQILVEQVAGREIDGDREIDTSPLPFRALPEGRFEHPVGQGLNQPAVLGEPDELVRRDVAVCRVAPAGERLEGGRARSLKTE